VTARVVAVAAIAAVLGLTAGTARASADDAPTLWQAIERAGALTARVHDDRAAVAAQRSAVASSASRLQRAADRLSRLQARVAGARMPALGDGAYVDQMRERLAIGAAVDAAERRLHAEQRRAAAERALPQLTTLQRRLDSAKEERRRELALVDALRGAVPGSAGGSNATREAWAAALLRTVQAPVCGNNLLALVTWQTAENTGAAFNPLATTLAAPGATSFNTVGVRNYPSLESGLAATVATLQGGYDSQGYGWILYRLRRCADPAVTAQAINASNWCRGCAGGAYVTGVLAAVRQDYPAYAGS
jgi:hypothetical protein